MSELQPQRLLPDLKHGADLPYLNTFVLIKKDTP